MLDLSNVPGGNKTYKFLTSPIAPVKPDKTARKRKDEITAASFEIEYTGNAPQVVIALDDLKQATADLSGGTVKLQIEVAEPSGRSREHKITIQSGMIRIEARTAFGAARAIRRIIARLDLRRAPFLEKGEWDSADTLEPSIAHSAFKHDTLVDLNWPEAYPENYLRRIAAAGYTGFHVNVNMTIFCQSVLFPELNDPKAEDNRKDLLSLVECAGKYGLDIFLSLYLQPMRGTHPVFARRPDVRGSRMVNTADLFLLCSSHPDVHEFYAEQMRDLFTAVPGLGGILAISGCEGWLHCHTANQPDTCPICAGKDIEKETAKMYNAMAKAVKDVSPESRFIVWNYGIFAWTDPCAEKFISNLSTDCTVMTNFDTGDNYPLEGAEGTYFDYSLSCVGPSHSYLKQAETAAAHKQEFMAKLESGAPLEYCSLAYVPAMTRWQRKYDRVMESSATGGMFNWKFIGYNCGLSQQAAGYTSMGEGKDLIRKIAIREFGKANASKMIAAWKQFDKAMQYHPFSGGTAGYFKGPFFIGPAQPLFLKEPTEIPPLFQYANPHRSAWATSLSFVTPFGVNAVLKALKKMRTLMEKGCALLPDNAGFHGAVCRMFLCYIRTAYNMTDFFRLRDSFYWAPYSPEQALVKIRAMRQIAREELENTKEAMAILEEYPEIAFSYTYRHGISMEQCEWKVKHTERLIDHDLPAMYYGITFGRHRHPVWLD